MSIAEIFMYYLLIHCVVCAILFILIKLDVFKISSQIFPVALLIPIWGVVILFIAEIQSRNEMNGKNMIDIHQFSLEEEEYNTVGLSRDNSLSSVIPVEEAILINDHKTRREFIMDVISQDSEDYIALLQKARFNDDVEVAHYAQRLLWKYRETMK